MGWRTRPFPAAWFPAGSGARPRGSGRGSGSGGAAAPAPRRAGSVPAPARPGGAGASFLFPLESRSPPGPRELGSPFRRSAGPEGARAAGEAAPAAAGPGLGARRGRHRGLWVPAGASSVPKALPGLPLLPGETCREINQRAGLPSLPENHKPRFPLSDILPFSKGKRCWILRLGLSTSWSGLPRTPTAS